MMNRKFTVLIESKAHELKDGWMCPTEGEKHWLSVGDYGPEPHSMADHAVYSNPSNQPAILLFETFEEAEEFAKNWPGRHHVIPNGNYQVIEL